MLGGSTTFVTRRGKRASIALARKRDSTFDRVAVTLHQLARRLRILNLPAFGFEQTPSSNPFILLLSLHGIAVQFTHTNARNGRFFASNFADEITGIYSKAYDALQNNKQKDKTNIILYIFILLIFNITETFQTFYLKPVSHMNLRAKFYCYFNTWRFN